MKQWFLYPLAATAMTALLHLFVGVPLGLSALIAFIGWPLIGTAITSDDDFVGGFSNPDGMAKPDWETAEYWGKLSSGGAAVCVAFLMQLGLGAPWPVCLIPAALLLALASLLLLRRARRVSHHAG